MMILRSSPASPFGRKVKIAAKLLGLWNKIELVDADTTNPADSLRQQNPLGKIPALILEDGEALYDSAVIVQYLQDIAGGEALIPRERSARFAALRLEALADGIQDAALLQVYEVRFREPALRDAKWVANQADKVARALAYLEAHLPADDNGLGSVAVACALGYLDLRFEGKWRAVHPHLAAWLSRFETRVPAFAATKVVP
eukprot:gene16691-16870_t